MLDLAAAREGSRNRTISYIGLVGSSQNVADALKKAMQQMLLQLTFRTGSPEMKQEQWVIRKQFVQCFLGKK